MTDGQRTAYVIRIIKSCKTAYQLIAAGEWSAKQMARISNTAGGCLHVLQIKTAFSIHRIRLFP